MIFEKFTSYHTSCMIVKQVLCMFGNFCMQHITAGFFKCKFSRSDVLFVKHTYQNTFSMFAESLRSFIQLFFFVFRNKSKEETCR